MVAILSSIPLTGGWLGTFFLARIVFCAPRPPYFVSEHYVSRPMCFWRLNEAI